MGSLVKRYSKKKLTGQVFTPAYIIDKILDDIGYNSSGLLGKTILDPACGDGRFLVKIAERIIRYSPAEELKYNLEKLYGWDIDPVAVKSALDTLDKLVLPYNIKIEWNIHVADALYQLSGDSGNPRFFDYIVGNPPYIRIQHLEIKQREYIRNHYKFCRSGSTDIFIAFYELAAKLLNIGGVCGFITPNTLFYTATAQPLRDYLSEKSRLRQITNYGSIRLFEHTGTYSAIVIFSHTENTSFSYQEAIDKRHFRERIMKHNELINKKFWQLSIEQPEKIPGKRLGDIADIHVGITTLADRIYIMPVVEKQGKHMLLQSKYNGIIHMERDILKPIVKASTLKTSGQSISEYILFPYKKVDGKHKLIPERELQEKYPLAYKYLLSVRSRLDRRDNGKPNKAGWYAFGRSQGLNTGFGKKILFSPMNKKPNFIYHPNEEATFYSGYCIKYSGDNEALLKQLNSERMEAFIRISSRDFRGGWKAYNKKIIQEFIVRI